MSWIGLGDLYDWLGIGLDVVWKRANSLRPPPAVDFSWKSTWPIPLYGLACLAHRRLRVRNPRRFPTLTTVRLPEIYGVLALGHVAHLEANRLARKVAEDESLDIIETVAGWAQSEYRAYPQRFVPIGKAVDLTISLVGRPVNDFEVWKYRLRCSWSDEERRIAPTAFLTRWQAAFNVPQRDAALVTLFVSEQIKGFSIFHPTFLHDRALMVEVAFVTAFAMLNRWMGAHKGALRTSALLQRYFFYILAFKWLGGRYCHYASIFGLDDVINAAKGAGMCVLDWNVKHGKGDADPGAMFHKYGFGVPPWFGEGSDTTVWT